MLAKRSSADKNQYSKKWYRSNKSRIKKRKEGLVLKKRKANSRRTETGRNRVQYNTRKKAERRSLKWLH